MNTPIGEPGSKSGFLKWETYSKRSSARSYLMKVNAIEGKGMASFSMKFKGVMQYV